MKKYEVLVSFYYEKKTYPVGDNIELSEQDAKQLLRSNYIKELDEASKKQAEPKPNDEPKADEPNDLGEEQKADEPTTDELNEEPKPEEQKAKEPKTKADKKR